MKKTHIKLDDAIVAAMIKAREVGVKMLASDCEQILSAAGIDGQFMDCGHHKSLLLTSAETGEPLYCEYCDMRDQRNDLLASAPEVGEAVEMGENTAKRFRGILSMLGISAPESDESLMLCQFSLLGMMRHKIQQIYDQPDRTAQLEAKLETERQRLAACGVAALGYFEGCSPQYKSGSLEDVLRLRDSNKQLQADNKRLVEHLKQTVDAFERQGSGFPHPYEHNVAIIEADKALLAEMEAKG